MKYMMAKVLYGAVGILLAAACICTGEKKLSQTDRQIYEKACSLEQEMEMLGFSGFSSGTTEFAIMTGTVTM